MNLKYGPSKIEAKFTAAFGVNDERGRSCGSIATVRSSELTPSEGSWYINPDVLLGLGSGDTIFIVEHSCTRNGIAYGASQPVSYAASLDDALHVARTRIETARKRYTKKYATNGR